MSYFINNVHKLLKTKAQIQEEEMWLNNLRTKVATMTDYYKHRKLHEFYLAIKAI